MAAFPFSLQNDTMGLSIGHGENTWELTGGKGIADDGTGQHWEEFWFNEAVGKYAYFRLREIGFNVVLPQKWDSNQRSLNYKEDMFDEKGTKFNICIHANAGPKGAKGACGFFWYAGQTSRQLAEIWLKHFKNDCPEQGLHGDGLHESYPDRWPNFHMIRETNGITLLIEHGFFTTPEQLKNLKDPDFQKKCGEVIVKTACEFIGIEYVPKTKYANSVSVDGRAVGAYSEIPNVLRQVEAAVKTDYKKIEIEKVKL